MTLAGALLRLWHLGQQSFWFDESHTVWVLHTSISDMLARISGTETSPPVYYLAAWLWSHAAGTGEAGLRSLPAAAGVLTIPVVYGIGDALASRRAGLAAAALTAFNPLLIWYSQEARSYALLVLLCAVTLLAIACLRRQPSRGWMIAWSLAAALAIATHYYAALLLIPEGVWLFLRHRRLRAVRIGLVLVAVWTVPVALLAFHQLDVQFLGAAGNWITKVSLAHRLGDVPRTFVLGPAAPAPVCLLASWGVVLAVAVALVRRRADADERAAIRFALELAAAGFGLVLVLVTLGFDQLDYRNVIALWLPCALALGIALGVRRGGLTGTAGVAALCATGALVVIAVATEPSLQRPNWRALARATGTKADRAIVLVGGCQVLPLSLYLPGLERAPSAGASVRELDVVSSAGQRSWYDVLFSGWYTICNPQPRAVAVPRRLGGFQRLGRVVRINQFSVVRFRASRPAPVSDALLAHAGIRGVMLLQQPQSGQLAGG